MRLNFIAPTQDAFDDWLKYIAKLKNHKSNDDRKANSKRLHDYIEGDQLKYLETELATLFNAERLKYKRRIVSNLASQIIDTISIVYGSDVKRQIVAKNKKKIQQQYDDYIWTDSLDYIMAQTERQTNYDRMALIYPRWDEAKDAFKYSIYHQYHFDLAFDAQDNLAGVIISDYGKEEKETFRTIITATTVYQCIGAQLTNRVEHNLGFIPVKVVYAKDPGFEHYLLPDVNLSQSNLEWNLGLSNFLNMLNTKASGTTVISIGADSPIPGENDANPNLSDSNSKVERDLRAALDPDAVVILRNGLDGSESKMYSLSSQTDFTGGIETLYFVASSVCKSYECELGELTITTGVSPKTATEMYITDQSRTKINKIKKHIFREAEYDMYEITSKILEIAKKITAIPVKDINIEYIPQNRLYNITNQELKAFYDSGLLNRVQATQKLHPELNDEETVEYLKKVDELESQLNDAEQVKQLSISKDTEIPSPGQDDVKKE